MSDVTSAGAPPPPRLTLKERLEAYEKLTRLDKPIGIFLLLWPTLWALWLAAKGVPPLIPLWIFILGTVVMRSAGCAINDWADRDFDGRVERTRDRPLAAGLIAPREALIVAAVLALCAFGMVLMLNRLTILLSFAAVVIAGVYPFFKRFFAVPQAFLGLAFSFGIPMAFAAVRNEVPTVAWAMVAVNAAWVLAYDTEYAMVDREDDLKIGIKTSAITFGRFDVAIVMLSYAVFVVGMAWIGREMLMGPAYYLGLGVASAIVAYHYLLIHDRDPQRCFRAFRHNNWLGLAVFAGVVADYATRGKW